MVKKLPIMLIFILSFAVILRLWNLNYNSAHLDEASYLMVGRFGLFEQNWEEFDPATWVGGAFWFYPTISALGGMFGEIVGSRAINTLIGTSFVFIVYSLVKRLQLFKDEEVNKLTALFATFIVGISSVSINLSRFATYDILSFTLFALGLVILLLAVNKNLKSFYFISSIIFLLSFLAKYFVIIFFPFVILLAFLKLNKEKNGAKLEILNFVMPLAVGLIGYIIFNFSDLAQFYKEQVPEQTSYVEIVTHFWQRLQIYYILASIGFIVLLFWRESLIKYIILFFFPLSILFIHLFTQRLTALDKHIFLGMIPLTIIISASLAKIVQKIPSLGITTTIATIGILGTVSYFEVRDFEESWPNASEVTTYLDTKVTSHEKVLVQEGITRLVLMDKLEHDNVVTIYSFEYNGLTGNEAYTEAIKDGYFDLIQSIDNIDQ